jgi:predicted ATPase
MRKNFMAKAQEEMDRRAFLVLMAGAGAGLTVNAEALKRLDEISLSDQQQPLSRFNVYRGNSHSHTIFTWTHGAHRAKSMSRLTEPTEFKSHWKVPPGTDWKDWK